MSGIEYYINDLNTRFTNLLFNSDEYQRNFNGLALNIGGIPKVKQNGEYIDVLLDDNYDISTFFIEVGDRKMQSYGFDSKIDLVVMVKTTSFTGHNDEDIIEEVYEIAKVTPFYPFTDLAINETALVGFEFENKVNDTLYPFYVFRFKSNLTGILKQK